MTDSLSGLLYSQIGYDLGEPMRAILRSTDPAYVPEGTVFELRNAENGQLALSGPVTRWGTIWKSHWWTADFSELREAGTYRLAILSQGQELCASEPFEVGQDLLWEKTLRLVALDQLEERARRARHGNGWNDCGSDWREVNSHAAMLIGLCDLWSAAYIARPWLEPEDIRRLAAQVMVGCDYIALCQDKAEELGLGRGAIVHEITNQVVVIPADLAQSVVALARASRLVYEFDRQKSRDYLERAERAYRYLTRLCQPYGGEGFSAMNHGAPAGFAPPKEFMTRDLVLMVWGGVELWAAGRHEYKEDAVRIARQVMRRQVPEDRKEGEFYGHFYTFDHCDFTEKANTHHHVGHDTGAIFPHYLVPFMEMLTRWYDHPDAPLWRETVHKFAYGYFLPACSQNPFYLLPEGYFSGQGLLTFCGPWHGINASLLFGATLAARLEMFTGDRRFRQIATGNIQWVAGLNAGITRQAMQGCVIWKEEIEAGVALPYSQIQGVGRRSIGTWTGIPGTIVNGFSVNPQFQLVVEPTVENDGPWLYTDEDWIPHSGGWVSALTQMRLLKFFRL